jgi:hypothetical protein
LLLLALLVLALLTTVLNLPTSATLAAATLRHHLSLVFIRCSGAAASLASLASLMFMFCTA